MALIKKITDFSNSLEIYNSRRNRYKRILENAKQTSTDELTSLVMKLIKDPSSKDLVESIKKVTNASTWISHSYLRYLLSHIDFNLSGEDPQHSEINQEIIQAIRNSDPLGTKYSHEQIFKAIYDECEYSQYHTNYTRKLEVPKKNITIVLVSGVFNEIFSTAAFERGAQHLSKLSGVKYFVANVKGTKSSDFNEKLLTEQIQDYLLQNPEEKLWLVGYSKGGVDCLRFMKENKELCEKSVLGFSAIASPILGSDHVNHKFLKTINKLHDFSDTKIYKFIEQHRDVLAKEFQYSLSSTHQRVWFRRHYNDLPKSPFYTSLAFKASWYESHLWMILTKLIFRSNKDNDGIVDADNALYPSYFNGINLGVIKGHHLVGTRSSFYCQEALLESLIIFNSYLKLL